MSKHEKRRKADWFWGKWVWCMLGTLPYSEMKLHLCLNNSSSHKAVEGQKTGNGILVSEKRTQKLDFQRALAKVKWWLYKTVIFVGWEEKTARPKHVLMTSHYNFFIQHFFQYWNDCVKDVFLNPFRSKLHFREVKQLVQAHTASEYRAQGLTICLPLMHLAALLPSASLGKRSEDLF